MKTWKLRGLTVLLIAFFIGGFFLNFAWASCEPGSCRDIKDSRINSNVLETNIRLKTARAVGEQYNSYFYTLSDVVVFSYYDETEYSVIDPSGTVVANGTLNKDQKAFVQIEGGIYTLVSNKKFSYLVGDPVSYACTGYYAIDENGYASGTKFFTYGSTMCGDTIVIFAFDDNTSFEISNLDTREILDSGNLNKGEHYEINGSERFFKITSDKNVSVLNHDDQGYYVASNSKTFVGTEFYTFTQAKWTNGCNVVAYQDATDVIIKNRTTDEVVWSGVLNKYEHHSERFSTPGTYIDIVSSKPVSVSMLPIDFSTDYHHSSYVPDSDGSGIGKEFVTYALDGSDAYIYVFSYGDDNHIEIYDDSGNLINDYELNAGDAQNINPGHGWYRIQSTEYISVMSGYGYASASFVPVPFFFYSGDREAPKISNVLHSPDVPASLSSGGEDFYIKWETDEEANSFVNMSVNNSPFDSTFSDDAFLKSHSIMVENNFSSGDIIKYYVRSVDYNGNATIDNNNGEYYLIRIQDAPADINLSRTYSRNGNFFSVTLELENTGEIDAKNVVVYDYVKGFQGTFDSNPFFDNGESCRDIEVRAVYHPEDKETTIVVKIDEIKAKEKGTVSYRIVPILYETDINEYKIGSKNLKCKFYQNVDLWLLAETVKEFDLATVIDREDVFTATREADYLIVTNPKKLYKKYLSFWDKIWDEIIFWQDQFEDRPPEVLMLAGQLAAEKNGVLGYIEKSDKNKLKDLLVHNWDPSLKSKDNGHLNENWNDGGYLLLVGENNIIPSFDNQYNIRFSDDPPDKKLKATSVDNEYADIQGNDHLPELIVGRLIGNFSKHLSYQFKKITNGEFSRDNALLVSGTGGGTERFKQSVNECDNIISKEYTNVKLHLSDEVYDSDEKRLNAFKDNTSDKGLIYYRNHGGIRGWGHWLGIDDVDEISFGSSYPFIYSNACLTGRYADTVGLGEKYLAETTTIIFFGSTETSPRSENNAFAKYFFETEFIDMNVSIGEAIKETKRSYGNNNDWKYYTIDEYNIYGDPKIGLEEDNERMLHSKRMKREKQVIEKIDVSIPDYEVNSEEGIDYISIPGGTLYLEPDRPEMPIYKSNTTYPPGYKIQSVAMTKKTNMSTATGLNLPSTDISPGIDGYSIKESAQQCGWYPEQEFSWEALENPDGTTTLTITVFPFYYDECTTDVQYFNDYSFDVDYIVSTIEIKNLSTSEYEYKSGEDVVANLNISNPGDAIQAILKSEIKSTSGEIVATLPEQAVEIPSDYTEKTITWNSSGQSAGRYVLECTIVDDYGNILDSETKSFNIGIIKFDINHFDVTEPVDYISQGDDIIISMEFKNTGSLNSDANAVIEVINEEGNVIVLFSEDYSDVVSDEIITFEKTWDTSDISDGFYGIVGYVTYNNTSTATDIVSLSVKTFNDLIIEIKTDKEVYLPDEKVLFEAQIKDEWGNIIDTDDAVISVIRPDETYFAINSSYRTELKKFIGSFSLSPIDPMGIYKIQFETSDVLEGYRSTKRTKSISYTEDIEDNCPDDPDKTEPGICGCGTPDTDRDWDTVADCNDNCPDDPNKTDPGICGCRVPDTDSDNDGTPDCNDTCPNDPYDTCNDDYYVYNDTDGDGTVDSMDGCYNDPNKTEPGVCGCGVADADTDEDGTPDCNDNCPEDPAKTEPGICGCGVADTDTDEDGTPDCNDNCPEDPAKTEPGVCGCGVADADTDEDETLDCNDNCPNDPDKTEPGLNGCGVVEDLLTADAGPDQTVAEGATIMLDGTKSTSLSGDITSYSWAQTGGVPQIVFSDPASSQPTFFPSAVSADAPLVLTFTLTAKNEAGNEDTDEVIVTVQDNGITGFPEGVIPFKTVNDNNMGIRGEIGYIVALNSADPAAMENDTNKPEEMPYGMSEMVVNVDQPGDTAVVNFYLLELVQEDAAAYRHSETAGWMTYGDNVTFSEDRKSVALTAVDGGELDVDGQADGKITLSFAMGVAVDVEPPEQGTDDDTDDVDDTSSGEDGDSNNCFIGISGAGAAYGWGSLFYLVPFIFIVIRNNRP